MEFQSTNNAKNPTSVLEGNGYYFDRLFLREKSIGCSSRIYYRSSEGVPFQWERQPGTPINPPENEVISPLTPPPKLQNIGLPMPCFDKQKQKEPSLKITGKMIMLWKKMKKIEFKVKENVETTESDIVESSGHFDSDREGSFRKNSSLSSSSSVYSCDFPRLEQSKKPFVCSTWDITTKMVGFAKRV